MKSRKKKLKSRKIFRNREKYFRLEKTISQNRENYFKIDKNV